MMVAFPDDRFTAHENRTDRRVGRRIPNAALGELVRAIQEQTVEPIHATPIRGRSSVSW
jgi:hypothetical protein